MNYFAYGSNMSVRRLCNRISEIRIVGPYLLRGRALSFNKVGKDGSGKCNVLNALTDLDGVFGVVFNIPKGDIAKLDSVEGLGTGYRKEIVRLEGEDGQVVSAFTYIALQTDHLLKPFDWYLHHVRVGAEEANLSSAYVARLQKVESIVDSDSDRTQRELQIYED